MLGKRVKMPVDASMQGARLRLREWKLGRHSKTGMYRYAWRCFVGCIA